MDAPIILVLRCVQRAGSMWIGAMFPLSSNVDIWCLMGVDCVIRQDEFSY
jgi:hypothetical protein